MNVMRNVKATKATKGKPTYRTTLDFKFVEQANPDRVVNQKVLKDISKDTFGHNTTTTVSSSSSQMIIALTEGRGHARCEVGIAALDINSPMLLLTQISDNLYYSDTLNKIQILNPFKILLLDTMFGIEPRPKLIALLKETFRDVQLLPVQRRYFNEKLGLEQITKFSSRKSKNILQIIVKKYYCLSAASALLSYIKDANSMTFGENCLKVDYQTKQFAMMIDTQTAARLELLYTLSSEKNASKKFSLFSILNKCVTRIGERNLRAAILEPSCNIDFIRNRQEQIKVLMEKSELIESLKENIQNFKSVDQLLKISCIVPADDCEKAIETNIQMSIQLKTCLEGVKPLHELITNLVSDSYESARNVLSATVINEIIEKIDAMVQNDIHKNRLAQKHFQHLFAVKAHLNESVDFLRSLYKDVADKIQAYVTNLIEECQLPIKLIFSTKLGHHLYMKCPQTTDIEIPENFQVIQRKINNIYLTTSQLIAFNDTAKMIASDIIRLSNTMICDMLISIASEIDAIHLLIGTIIDLDLVQSLSEVAKEKNYCCPSFSKVMRIEEAYHPILEYTKNIETVQSIVTNNVIATPQYNFYLISGPNMSGKTVYLKMIALIQILSQIGSFVPCKSAKMRMTDKIFSRIGFHDCIEQSASSFTVELREMEYIFSNLTPNSLVIIDELFRSTNPQEGETLCWKFCEKLLRSIGISDDSYFKTPADDDEDISKQNKSNFSLPFQGTNSKLSDVSRPFIYFTTHFKSLTKLSDKFNNAINLHMLTLEKISNGKPFLEFKYKIQSGKSNISNYGLALARCLRFPQSLLKRAEEIIEQIEDESFESQPTRSNAANETLATSLKPSEVMNGLEKDVIDLYSYILLLMSFKKDQQSDEINVDVINSKLNDLVDKMSPEFKENLKTSSLNDVLSELNSTTATSFKDC